MSNLAGGWLTRFHRVGLDVPAERSGPQVHVIRHNHAVSDLVEGCPGADTTTAVMATGLLMFMLPHDDHTEFRCDSPSDNGSSVMWNMRPPVLLGAPWRCSAVASVVLSPLREMV